MFWVGPNGSIEHAYFQDGLPWLRFPQVAPPGSASTIGSLAAVSRAPNTWEIFWLSPDGDVEDAYHYDTPGALALGSPSGALTAVSRASNTLEVWWIGRDYSVQDAYWFEGSAWSRFTLSGPNSADSAIAAVAPSSSAMDSGDPRRSDCPGWRRRRVAGSQPRRRVLPDVQRRDRRSSLVSQQRL